MEHPIEALITKPYRLVIGFMSGTSADGIDAVLAEMHGHGTATRVKQRDFVFIPFAPEVRAEILRLASGGSAAALLGAPLTHDFAVISLSDRLTPWETIEKRLDCAAAADLTIVLYNPASHGRPDHVKRACDILLRRLPEDRLCGIVRNIGRDGQSRRILTLAELREAEVDMFCTVFIGNSAAKTVAGQLITPRGYRNV